MRTVDRTRMRAPVGRVLEAAVEVERWPELLPHYRWVRRLERRGDGGLVEMAAWRPFGPLNYPTWWVSEMWVDRAAPAVYYRHVRGITSGMDVVWRIEPAGDQTDVTIVHDWTGPRWPLIGTRRRRVGDRTGVHSRDRVADPGGHPAGGGDGSMSEARRVVITGIGAITPIGLGVDGLWAGLRRRTSAVRCITRFDPERVQVPRGRRGRRTSWRRTTSRSVGPAGSTATRSSPSRRPAWPSPMRALDLRREDPDRVGAMMGTALGGVAHGERNVSRRS